LAKSGRRLLAGIRCMDQVTGNGPHRGPDKNLELGAQTRPLSIRYHPAGRGSDRLPTDDFTPGDSSRCFPRSAPTSPKRTARTATLTGDRLAPPHGAWRRVLEQLIHRDVAHGLVTQLRKAQVPPSPEVSPFLEAGRFVRTADHRRGPSRPRPDTAGGTRPRHRSD
jgi:hypothetical protein